MTDAETMGREAEQSDALDYAVKAGLVAYGVVHLLIGWLAIQLALGDHSRKASTKGAMRELASQGAIGTFLVWTVAIGMFLLVVWRVVEAAFGHRDAEEGKDRTRKRAMSGLKAILYAAVGWTALTVATGSGSSGGGGSEGLTAKLMNLPAGQWLVALVGLAIIGYGAAVAWRGWKEKFAEHLDTEGKMGNSGAAFLVFGKVGYIAKGISLAIVGGLFIYAGVTHRSQESGGLDQALQKILEQPFGQILLIAMGVGIACYGLFCFARARYLDR